MEAAWTVFAVIFAVGITMYVLAGMLWAGTTVIRWIIDEDCDD